MEKSDPCSAGISVWVRKRDAWAAPRNWSLVHDGKDRARPHAHPCAKRSSPAYTRAHRFLSVAHACAIPQRVSVAARACRARQPQRGRTASASPPHPTYARRCVSRSRASFVVGGSGRDLRSQATLELADATSIKAQVVNAIVHRSQLPAGHEHDRVPRRDPPEGPIVTPISFLSCGL